MSDLRAMPQNLSADLLEQDVILKISGLGKTFKQGGRDLTIFQNLSMKIESGEIVALVGPSGAGKSTLLQIAGLLDQPTAGKVEVNKQQAGTLGDAARTQLRQHYIGFVYQFHHLLPEFNAQENVAMPCIIAGEKRKIAMEKAAALLQSVGLGKRLDHRPARLSGGEQQRVAIARALVNDPKLLLADEPTGNLDPDTSAGVFEILTDHVKKRAIGALIATHNLRLADQMDRILELRNGKILPL